MRIGHSNTKFILTIVAILFSVLATAQTLTFKTNISSQLQETSGLLYLNGKLITHTDSGGEPALYEMDTTNGTSTRKVLIQNASNIDWEDITMDNDFIYIGDFGNNLGNRTNLRIYKISSADYLIYDTVLADTIQFNYADQIDFTPSNFTTNFDAEALISLGDSLYIFTKNWGNSKTYIYPISKQIGNYALQKTDSINAQGLITGAVCDSAQQILLIGYTFNNAFFIKINNWSGAFSSGQIVRNIIQPNSSIQIEGVAQLDSSRYFISSEKLQTTVAELHVLDTRFPTAVSDFTLQETVNIYPNPTTDLININYPEHIRTIIYSNVGGKMLVSKKKKIYVGHLAKGDYFLRIITKSVIYHQKLILQ